MTASPSQVANDLAAFAAFLKGRNMPELERAFRDGARIIRQMLDGKSLPEPAITVVFFRLFALADEHRAGSPHLAASLKRGAETIKALRSEAHDD